VAGAVLAVTVRAAGRAESLAVGLAQSSDRQGEKHLLTQHIFKQQTVLLIITDFGLVRCYGAFGGLGVGIGGAKDEVEVGSDGNGNGFDTAGAGYLEVAVETSAKADVGDDFAGAAVFVDDFGAAGGGEGAGLLGFAAKVNGAGGEAEVEFDGLAFELAYLEFHALRVRLGWVGGQWEGAREGFTGNLKSAS